MQWIMYLIFFCVTFFLSVAFTLLIRYVVTKLKILDYPGKERKLHKKPIPLMGGLAIYASFFLAIAIFFLFFQKLPGTITGWQILGLFISLRRSRVLLRALKKAILEKQNK